MPTTTKKTTINYNFTRVATSSRSGGTTATLNLNADASSYARLALPADLARDLRDAGGVELLADSNGADALLLRPCKNGRAVHKTQRFVVVPRDFMAVLKHRHYNCDAQRDGAGKLVSVTLTPIADEKTAGAR